MYKNRIFFIKINLSIIKTFKTEIIYTRNKVYTISIQDKVLLFQNGALVGETTIEKIEDFCNYNNLTIPVIWDENDDNCKLLIKEYFGVKE